MFNSNWSTEQIEQELASSLASGTRSDAADPSFNPPLSAGAGSDASVVLARVTDLLENQSLFKSEVRSLRDEIAELRQERLNEQKRYDQALSSMELEMADLRLLKMDQEGLGGGKRSKAARAPQFPLEDYLACPLVIRTSQDEFLGVLGKVRKHFALRDFVYLVETSVKGRSVELSWELQNKHWSLVVSLEEDDQEQHFILVTQETVTPSKNVVTEILSLNINGADVPDSLLLSLFKKIKDTFDK